MQCSPVFSGNFTPSGRTVKVTSGYKAAKIDSGFTFVVRIVLFVVSSFHWAIFSVICKIENESCCSEQTVCVGCVVNNAEISLQDVVKVSGCFCIQDPVIHEIFPTFGPKSGRTMLTIRGDFLDAGNKQSVTVGKEQCNIMRSVQLLFFFSFCFFPPDVVCPLEMVAHSRWT